MSEVLAQLPEVLDQESFNLQRWCELEADPFLASLDCRIETNRFGQIIMRPPPGFQHSDLQGQIFEKLRDLMLPSEGRVLPECPVSTSGGVKGIDLAWISRQRVAEGLRQNVLTIAPEICIEVLSPGNTRAEIEEIFWLKPGTGLGGNDHRHRSAVTGDGLRPLARDSVDQLAELVLRFLEGPHGIHETQVARKSGLFR